MSETTSRVERAKRYVDRMNKVAADSAHEQVRKSRTILCKTGRSGVKIHKAYSGSAMTFCGIRARGGLAPVQPESLTARHEACVCERCFPE